MLLKESKQCLLEAFPVACAPSFVKRVQNLPSDEEGRKHRHEAINNGEMGIVEVFLNYDPYTAWMIL